MYTDKLMKCGHPADCIMRDVPHQDMKVDVAACSYCFDYLGTAIQPACNMADKQPVIDKTPLPKIKRDHGGIVVALFAFATIVTLLVARMFNQWQ